MTTILEQIKTASLTARKERNAVASSLLTTLLSEVVMVGKNANRETTDPEAIAIVKKFVNNNTETAKVADIDTINRLTVENEILTKFLPKQMTEAEVKEQLTNIKASLTITNPKEMGKMLAELKAKFAGQYDGAVAAKVAKELLA